jgi:hypothetical protein
MRRAAYGGLAYEKPQSALRAFVRFFSGTFFCALETYGFLYRAQKNVAYNRNEILIILRNSLLYNELRAITYHTVYK